MQLNSKCVSGWSVWVCEWKLLSPGCGLSCVDNRLGCLLQYCHKKCIKERERERVYTRIFFFLSVDHINAFNSWNPIHSKKYNWKSWNLCIAQNMLGLQRLWTPGHHTVQLNMSKFKLGLCCSVVGCSLNYGEKKQFDAWIAAVYLEGWIPTSNTWGHIDSKIAIYKMLKKCQALMYTGVCGGGMGGIRMWSGTHI